MTGPDSQVNCISLEFPIPYPVLDVNLVFLSRVWALESNFEQQFLHVVVVLVTRLGRVQLLHLIDRSTHPNLPVVLQVIGAGLQVPENLSVQVGKLGWLKMMQRWVFQSMRSIITQLLHLISK